MISLVYKYLFLIYFSFLLFIFMFIHLIVAPVGMWFYKDPFYGHMKLAVPFLKTLFKLTGIRLTVNGLENIPTDQHFLIVSNHQSLLDIFVYMIIIPRRISFIFKKELMKVPILNVSLLLQGHAILDRQNPRKAISQLKKVETFIWEEKIHRLRSIKKNDRIYSSQNVNK